MALSRRAEKEDDYLSYLRRRHVCKPRPIFSLPSVNSYQANRTRSACESSGCNLREIPKVNAFERSAGSTFAFHSLLVETK